LRFIREPPWRQNTRKSHIAHGPNYGSTVTKAQHWLTERELRKQAVKAEDKTSLSEERKRFVKAQADKEELENEKRRGEVIYFETALDVITSVVSLVTSRLEGVAGRLAADLVNESNPAVIREKLLAEHRAIRQSLSDAARGLSERSQRMAAGIRDAKTSAY
jgi:hypothetical protein